MSKPNNIALIGFMGTGKSTLGKRLAEILKRAFIDMDNVIEKRTGKPIGRIFAEEGEAHFRHLERELIKELAQQRDLVIACGGGIVLNHQNVIDLSSSGLIVCISATPQEILRRVTGFDHRPLLESGDKAGKILELLKARQPLYDAIPYKIDTTGLSVEAIVNQILEKFKSHQQPRVIPPQADR